MHAPTPWQSPPQPARRYPVAGVARSRVFTAAGSTPEQREGHETPAPITFPRPLTATLSANDAGPKTAMRLLAPSIVVAQAPRPVHTPFQPTKREPADGTAPSSTCAPLSAARLQAVGHETVLAPLTTRPFAPSVETLDSALK